MGREKEIKEAIVACDDAISTVRHALDQLDSAQGWGIFDLFGGGLISSLIKHDKMDKAEELLGQIERDMEKLEKELSDIKMSLSNYETPSGINRTFDIFFDNFFSDWSTQSSIKNNISVLTNLNTQLKNLKVDLETQLKELNM